MPGNLHGLPTVRQRYPLTDPPATLPFCAATEDPLITLLSLGEDGHPLPQCAPSLFTWAPPAITAPLFSSEASKQACDTCHLERQGATSCIIGTGMMARSVCPPNSRAQQEQANGQVCHLGKLSITKGS